MKTRSRISSAVEGNVWDDPCQDGDDDDCCDDKEDSPCNKKVRILLEDVATDAPADRFKSTFRLDD